MANKIKSKNRKPYFKKLLLKKENYVFLFFKSKNAPRRVAEEKSDCMVQCNALWKDTKHL